MPALPEDTALLPVVLVVDDDPGVRFTLAEVLKEADVAIRQAEDGAVAWEMFEREGADLVITDLRMPEMDGMELLERVRASGRPTKVVMITAHGSEADAVKAMKQGAYDYFSKPFEIDDVLAVVRRATDSLRLGLENRRLRADLALARRMVFCSRAMSDLAQLIERAAARDVTVLITGESGTGKELVAEAIVAASPRGDGPFVRFNCAAVPRDLAEAELFGHEKGAFTGAVRERPGLFRQAHGGTLFLDEIADLDLTVQAKLLRVLQDGQVRPIGADAPVPVDVRIICATHSPLDERVADQRFREDLYYRLNVVSLRLPPLRERPEDIDPLIDHFVRRCSERFGIEPPRVHPQLRVRLATQPYPGNVRELENTIERLVAMCPGDELCDEPQGSLGGGAGAGAGSGGDGEASVGLKARVEAFERHLIVEELQRCGGNKSEAARRLKLGRVTLLDKIRKYDID